MRIGHHQHLVFIGDSITDCGRRDVFAPFGNGYVSLIEALVTARYPDRHIRITNTGIGGDRVRDLDARWQTDAIDLQPDWLAIKIGINDVWRAFGQNPDESVPLDEYEQTLRRLATSAVEQTGCRLIMIEPYHIEKDRTDPQRTMLDGYREAVRRIAQELDAVFVETQSAFDAVLESTTESDWAADKVHPNLAGHAVIALNVLRALEFDINEGA